MAGADMTDPKQIALEAIRKKLIGKKLNYQEYYHIIDQIVHGDMGEVITTYFAAASFTKNFTNQELYYLTKAMVKTGDQLKFSGIVADKHSVGGVPGYRTTPVIVPIIAAAGLRMPKTSSRGITSPAGTADVMETLTKVSFSARQIRKIVEKTGACLVWGGTIHLAPADNEFIEVGRVLSFESYDKVVASVMAKKVAAGATHLLIDIPYGHQAKVKKKKDADLLASKFLYLAKRFNIKIAIDKIHLDWPIAPGIGPLLEMRECLRVLQQKSNRSLLMEKRSLKLASLLLKLCGLKENLAQEILVNGQAWRKMQEIIASQGGKPQVDSEDLQPGRFKAVVRSQRSGVIQAVVNANISYLCRVLGTPQDHRAGIYLKKNKGDRVKRGKALLVIYSSAPARLAKAKKELTKGLKFFKIRKNV